MSNELKENLKIGTSGFYFPDWAKTFYPKSVPRNLWLRYYISKFDTLELNTTFYAIPSAERVEKIVSQMPKNFELIVKVPREITHLSPSETELKSVISRFMESIEPAKEKGIVSGYLAQFPVSFRPDDSNRKLLSAILKSIPGQKFVEFRNKQWQSDSTFEILKEHCASWVIPDVPTIPELTQAEPILTSPIGYVRLHGRNEKNWYSSERDRYDYLYSENELSWIFELSKSLFDMGAKKVFVFFNNCHMGQAPQNAIKFAELTGINSPELKLFVN